MPLYIGPESGEKAPIESQGEQENSTRDEQWVAVAEVYVRFDAVESRRRRPPSITH